MGVPVFIDTENLRDLTELGEHVQRSHNLVLLLTKGVLKRPWCLLEILTAVNSGVRIVPVEIQRKDMQFEYPDDAFFQRLLDGRELDPDATNPIGSEGFNLASLEQALRHVFKRIALPFSPHKTTNVREAELQDILKQCSLRDEVHKDSVLGVRLSNR